MYSNRRVSAVGFLVLVSLTACAQQAEEPAGEEPAQVEEIEGSDLSRVILTADAANRLGIETVEVQSATSDGSATARAMAPYAAILYDASGNTWTYTNPSERVFLREAVVIDRVVERGGERVALLSDGPSAGTRVVTVGAAELFGAETGVGGGH
jgi:hypothetical protein